MVALIPILTSNTSASNICTVSVSSEYSGYESYKAFDGKDNTLCEGEPIIQFVSPKKVTKFDFYCPNTDSLRDCQTLKLQASNDGISWKDLTGVITNTKSKMTITVNNNTAYSYYKFSLTSTKPGVNGKACHTAQLYGY